MKNRIGLHLVGLDTRTEAGIKLALRNLARDKFIIAEKGDISLVDGDSTEGSQYIKAKLRQSDIILVTDPSRYSSHEYVFKKPLRIKELMNSLEEIVNYLQSIRNKEKAEKTLGQQTSTVDAKTPSTPKKQKTEQTQYEANPFQKYYAKDYKGKATAPSPVKKTVSHSEYEANPFQKYQSKNYLEQLLLQKQQRDLIGEDDVDPEAKLEMAFETSDDSNSSISDSMNAPPKKPKSMSVSSSTPERSEPVITTLDKHMFDGCKLYELTSERALDRRSLCGQNHDVNLEANVDRIYFDLKEYLGGKLLEIKTEMRLVKRLMLIKLDRDYILFDVVANMLYTNLPETSLYALSLMPYRGKVEVELVSSERVIRNIIRNSSIIYYNNLDLFLVLMVLWSAKGRLPNILNINTKILLLESEFKIFEYVRIPEVNKILSLWLNKELTIREVAESIVLPQRYIFSFCCVAYTLDLFRGIDTDNTEGEKDRIASLDRLMAELQKL